MGKQVQTVNKLTYGVIQKQNQKTGKGTLIARGYFTSDNKDEVGDIITRAATERAIPKYRQWANVRLMHQPKPVGKVLRIGTDDGLEWNEMEFEVIDPEAIFMVENGLLTALSVGINIRFDDIDFLEDGGWVINDYTLAEISLVDHPANYDARLKDLPVEQGLRVLARQYGMTALAQSMKELIDRELEMEQETEIIQVENELDPQPEEEIQEAEQVAEEETPEEPAAEEPEEAAPVAEEEPVIEAEPEAEEEQPAPVIEAAAPENEMRELITGIKGDLAELKNAIAEIQKALETRAEAPEATVQAAGDETIELGVSEEEPAEEEPEAGFPAQRTAALPQTEVPAEDGGEEKDKALPDLRTALRTYLLKR